MTTLLLVDDHPLFRRGLAAMLKAHGFEVLAEAASGTEAIALAERLEPEILLMDLGLPDMTGHAAIGRILARRPQQRVVVVSMFGDEVSVRQAMDAGALGYVLKDAPPEQVLAAVRAAEMGASLVGSGITRPSPSEPTTPAVLAGLTPRERSVAMLLAQGLPNRAIAERLGVAEKTVQNYVSTVLLHLGAADRYEAARIVRDS